MKSCYNYLFASIKMKNAHESHCSSVALLIVRIIGMLFFTGNFIWFFTFTSRSISMLEYIKYLTNYGFFFTWLYFIVAVQEHLLCQYYKENFKIYVQVLGEISLGLELPVTVIYWGALHDFKDQLSEQSWFFQMAIHALPLVFLLIDMTLNPFRYELSHYLFIFLAALCYSVCYVAYTLLEEPIYSILNLTDFLSYVFMVGAFVLAFIGLGLSRLVSYCWKEKVRIEVADEEHSEQRIPTVRMNENEMSGM